jgi:G:T-mismatch repair DNA endonuclease (very short patch repair protein)
MNHINTLEQRKNIFISRSTEVHNGKYDYSKVVYVRAQEKVEIVCPEHGSFWQVPDSHSRGAKVGCPSCGRRKSSPVTFSVRLSQEEFITKCKEVHDNFYGYENSVYTGVANYITITCPKHGSFEQRAYNHRNGTGCPSCNIEKRTGNLRKSPEKFIEQSKLVHGETYKYEGIVYNGSHEKVGITCQVHGTFYQTPAKHLMGQGCPLCGRLNIGIYQIPTQEEFISKCISVHGDKYDYSRTKYTKSQEKIEIICKVHGPFYQTPGSHINAESGCPVCGNELRRLNQVLSKEEYLKAFAEAHGDKYDYSKVVYISAKNEVEIICKELNHGSFFKTPNKHTGTRAEGCPKCSHSGTSVQEQELATFVKSLGLTILENDRTIIKPYEIDIVVPELKIGIEYNGLYWHSEQAGKSKTYHLDKLNKATEAGYRLIQIFENEWTHKKEIVKNRIRHILGKDTGIRLFARKLTLAKVTSKQARDFFTTYHIQGPCPARVAYGLFNGEDLVACMSFGINRFTKEKGIELIRYATAHNVVGGFSKLLSYFKKENPDIKSVTSYSDKNWSVGNVYEKNGFEYIGSSSPGYFYSDSTAVRINRVAMQAHKLKDKLEIYDENLTEVQNVTRNGYLRVFDSGQDKWELKL